MASGSNSMAGPSEDDPIDDLKTKLYDGCLRENGSPVFRQIDLLQFGVIPDDDVILLLQVCQRLCDEKLFKMVRDGSAAGWVCRAEEDAQKYRSLTFDQELVYALVDEAGQEGIWTKTIKMRSGLHDATMRAVLKSLETKHYISDMKSVEHLSRKMYIKFNLRPSEKATGGPWYTDGELDEDFIEAISGVLYKRILEKSFYHRKAARSSKPNKVSKSAPKKTESKVGADEARALRDAALNPIIKIEPDVTPSLKRRREEKELDHLVALPPGYHGYPTLDELTGYILGSGVTLTVLTKEDISQLLDMLCFDKKIERIVSGPEGIAYKAFRRSMREMEDGPENGLTEVPCGRCPVIDLCEEGGPVAPSNCEYFQTWLDA